MSVWCAESSRLQKYSYMRSQLTEKIAGKLGTCDMFHMVSYRHWDMCPCHTIIIKNISSHACNYTCVELPNIYHTYLYKKPAACTYIMFISLLINVRYLLSLPAHVQKTFTRAQNYSKCWIFCENGTREQKLLKRGRTLHGGTSLCQQSGVNFCPADSSRVRQA